MVEIGTKIKELREAKKMSQKELAEFLNVTPQAVSKWERNKSYPDLDTLLKLSKYFQVSTDKILGNEKQSFFDALFSKMEGRKNMKSNPDKTVKPVVQVQTSENGRIPKAIAVANLANILKINFDNGATKYLKSHYVQEMSDALSPSRGKGKRANLFVLSRNMWIGTEVAIKKDGTVVLNGKDEYTPEELWQNSQNSIPEL